MRFELIDQVLELDDQRIVAVRQVTLAEEYLSDHFPSFPVLPGVMMLESLVQAGRRLLGHRGVAGAARAMLAEVRNIRYGNMVRPGQALTVEVTLGAEKDGRWQMQGIGRVGEQTAVQGKFTLAPLAELRKDAAATPTRQEDRT